MSTNSGRQGGWRIQLIMMVADAILLNLAFVLAYVIRYRWQIGGAVEGADRVGLADLVPLQGALILVVFIVLVGEGLYRERRGVPWLDQLAMISRGTLVGLTIVLFAYLIFRPLLPSRLLFLYVWLAAIALLSGARLVVGAVQSARRRRGIGVERILIVGAGQVGRAIMQNILARPELGYQLVGFVDDDPAKQENIGRARALGLTDQTAEVVDRERIDEVIITLPWVSHRKVLDIMEQCKRRQVRFRIVPDLFQLSLSQVDIADLNGIPLIGVRAVAISETQRLLKRAIDIVGSALVLAALSPLLALTALLVKLDSPGPAFFRQTRVGRGGLEFTCYKFRTMRVGAEEELTTLAHQNDVKSITFKIREDPRRTRIGKWLRRWSIDELPQFFNVLRGDMSLVGPRPPLPSEVARYEDWHMKRLQVSPGITGIWQVMGRSDLPFTEMVMMDVYYIENWSLALDLKLLAMTIPAVLSGTGAY